MRIAQAISIGLGCFIAITRSLRSIVVQLANGKERSGGINFELKPTLTLLTKNKPHHLLLKVQTIRFS